MPPELAVVHAAVTWFMVGAIMLVQVLVYPQFLAVDPQQLPAFHRRHMERISWVVGPAMVLEAGLALGIAAMSDQPVAAWIGVALVGAIWLDTWLVEVPLHRSISAQANGDSIRRLIRANRKRVALWGARGVVAASFLV